MAGNTKRADRRWGAARLRWQKIAVSAIVLAIAGTTFAVAAEPNSEDPHSAGLSMSPVGEEGKEIVDERTATSQTFALPDGSRQTRLFESPINFRDEDGDWKPIDTELQEPANGAGIVNGDNSFDLRLPESMGEGSVRLAEDDQWVSYRLLGSLAPLSDVEGSSAAYETASGAVTFELTSNSTGVKEEIRLDDSSAPSSYAFELKAAPGLAPTLAEDGSLRFKDQDGKVFAVLPAPTIADASEDFPITAATDAVSYSLADGPDGSWRLTVAADPEWLADPERIFPVTIDPTVTIASAPYEGAIFSKPAPAGFGVSGTGYKNLPAAYLPNEDQTVRFLVRFDLAALPAGASIYDATLGLYSPATAENTPGVEVRQLTSPANTGSDWLRTHNFSGQVGYWKTPGGDFNPAVGAVINTSERPGGSAPGWWDFNSKELTDLVGDWKAGVTPNFGVIAKLTDETKGSLCKPAPPNCERRNVEWHTSTGPAGYRPKLVVSYWPAAPSHAKVISPWDGTRTAKRLKLQAGWNSGVTQVLGWQYREGKNGIFQPIPNELLRDGEGKAVSWPENIAAGVKSSKPIYLDATQLSATLRKKGGSVQVRALFEGGAAGISAPVEAMVDPALGGGDEIAPVGPGTVDLLTGNLTVTKTDVSIPTFNSSLNFSRTFNSRDAGKLGDTGVLGQGWKPGVPIEQNGAGAWRSVKFIEESETIEGETYKFAWAEVIGVEGDPISFEQLEDGTYETPDELTGWLLTKPSASQFVLLTPDGTRTIFSNNPGNNNNGGGGGNEYLPVTVSQTGGSNNSTQMHYDVVNGNRRLALVVAPSAPGVFCSSAPVSTQGCKTLSFNYKSASAWGAPGSYGDRLYGVYLWAPGFGGGLWQVAEYNYDPNGRLKEVWDPRISPPLKETYTYNATGQIETITPPGLKPWTMEYGTQNEEEVAGRLLAVKRDSLVPSDPVAKTTIAYGVPVSGSGAPYPMGAADVAKWGQTEIPVDATAIFPPDQVPTSSPPSDYSHATVYYMNSDGYGVNTATPKGAGTEAVSISTSETDQYGNVVRELTPQNRLRALAAGAESVARSHQLETSRVYEDEGTELVEEFGPLHAVRIQDGALAGQVKQARSYLYVEYDQVPVGVTLPTPAPRLPTTEKTAAWVEGALHDLRVNKTEYDWTLLRPTKTIVDASAGGLNIESVTVYDSETGMPIETRQPSNPGGGGAGTVKTTYYGTGSSNLCSRFTTPTRYKGLPCLIEPAAQPGTAGQPEIAVTRIAAYNQLGQPTEVWEAPGKAALEAGSPRRTTITTYDVAGRPQTVQRTGGGVTVPKVKVEYSSTTGIPTTRRFDCASGGCEGSDDQAVTTSYDSLGRAIEYKDADGNTATTTYDLLGRPVTTNDGKGTQTATYDATSGLLTKLEDSAAGTFTASYDADGNQVERVLPNGITAKTTFDEIGALTKLTYTKTSSCGASCTWLEFGAERSIHGQILSQTSSLSSQNYTYDKAGRLTVAKDTPKGGSCTTRLYSFDKNSNRTAKTTRPGFVGFCPPSGGTTQNYTYDAADRLTGEGIVYDDYGRTTSLPAVYAGGKTLTTSYFSTDMVASQSQNGVTNTFQLDASLRQRQRIQGGGLEGAEVFHYAGGSDAPAWTERGAIWSRNITGIGGELIAIQDSGSGTTIQLTNMHGDIVATASPSSTATALVSTSAYDEFGNPQQSGSPRFGWLGGNNRRTELASGVIQMGARSYVPMIGRFISVDPIMGGSASAYDYVNADPVNGLDLTGEAPFDKDCYSGIIGCQCVFWGNLRKGRNRGTLALTIVRKCRRFGGITLQGYAGAWQSRARRTEGWNDIAAPLPVFPSIRPTCIRITDPCQNFQRSHDILHCTPGWEYRLRLQWGFVFNFRGEGAEHYLYVDVSESCPA